jgi:hypothetical protein
MLLAVLLRQLLMVVKELLEVSHYRSEFKSMSFTPLEQGYRTIKHDLAHLTKGVPDSVSSQTTVLV